MDFNLLADVGTLVGAIIGVVALFMVLKQTRLIAKSQRFAALTTLREALDSLNAVGRDADPQEKCIHRFNYFQAVQSCRDEGLLPGDHWEAEFRYMEQCMELPLMAESWAKNRDIYTSTLMATLDPLANSRLDGARQLQVGMRRRSAVQGRHLLRS